MSDITYLLDTNVFIESYKKYYAPDLVSTFWQHLDEKSREGTVRSIDKVKDEIRPHNQFLTDWTNKNFVKWESVHNDETMNKYKKIMAWSTNHTKFNQRAKDEFALYKNADPWLIAHAMATESTVVTEEKRDDYKTGKISIPNACLEFDIKFMDTFQMLRELQIKLA